PCVRGYDGLAKVGQGGMGAVYKARHLRLNRIVALKVVGDAPNARPADLVRFRQEAEMIARLQHANIVQIYEVGEYAGGSYLALEYVDGSALDRQVNGTPPPAGRGAARGGAPARALPPPPGGGLPPPPPNPPHRPAAPRRRPKDHRLRAGPPHQAGERADHGRGDHGHAQLHGAR